MHKRILSHVGRGFTLIELLVVVAIIGILLAIMLPSFRLVRSKGRRSACASNQHQLHMMSHMYTVSNRGQYIICRFRAVQKAFNRKAGRGDDSLTDWSLAMQTVGLTGQLDKDGFPEPHDAWNDPSRNYKSQWEKGFPQLVVAYQYYAGIRQLRNPFRRISNRSPNNTTSARPDWLLIACTTGKTRFHWGGDRGSAYGDMPSHKAPGRRHPEGHNQIYVDGSSEWRDFDDLIYFHTWNTGGSRIYFGWQKDLGGWTPPPHAYGSHYR